MERAARDFPPNPLFSDADLSSPGLDSFKISKVLERLSVKRFCHLRTRCSQGRRLVPNPPDGCRRLAAFSARLAASRTDMPDGPGQQVVEHRPFGGCERCEYFVVH